MRLEIRPAIVLFGMLTLLTGVVYPLVVTGLAQAVFPEKANGSLIVRDGRAVGSALIGQEFSEPKYLWGRLSATSPIPNTSFNAEKSAGSSGSNLGPTNPVLIDRVRARMEALRVADAEVGYQRSDQGSVPVDLVTASASGLDPHISLAAAEYQVPRVARARGMTTEAVRAIVRQHTTPRAFGVLGEPVVNVLEVNLTLGAANR